MLQGNGNRQYYCTNIQRAGPVTQSQGPVRSIGRLYDRFADYKSHNHCQPAHSVSQQIVGFVDLAGLACHNSI